MQRSLQMCHTQIWSGAEHDAETHFNNSPWIRFHSCLNLFTRVERLFFTFISLFFLRRLCMMWLNPPPCMGTGRPLISSCLMRDIDRPHLTQWRVPLPSPPALVDADEIKRDDGSVKCGETWRRKRKLQWKLQLVRPGFDLWVCWISFYLYFSLSSSHHKNRKYEQTHTPAHRNTPTPLPVALWRRLIMIAGVTFWEVTAEACALRLFPSGSLSPS